MAENVDFQECYDQRAKITGLEYGKDRYAYRLIKKYFKPGQLVLDLGCGRGSFLNPLADRGSRLIGMDYSWGNVKILRNAGRTVVRGDALAALPFKEGTFDKVICSEFLEHFPLRDVDSIVKNIHRILKPGGLLFFTVPRQEKLEINYCTCPKCKHSFHRWGHFSSFDDQIINDLMKSNHFTLVKSMVIYGAFLYKLKVPLFIIRFLSFFDFHFPHINMALGNYLVIAKKP